MRGARTALLVVAVAMCPAALLAPVASAKGPPPPLAITGLTVTGEGQASGGSHAGCMFSYVVDFVGHMKPNDYADLWDSNGSDYSLTKVRHQSGSLQVTGVELLQSDFASGSVQFTVTITDKNHGVLTQASTSSISVHGSCPMDTYTAAA